MKIAAIYARKSTEQDVADDAKSVTRQVDNAKAFAAAQGWVVDDRYIFIDDGVSGADTRRLRQRQRMMDLVQGACPFAVIVMQAQDRFSRRGGAEALLELQALASRVEVWCYADRKRFEHGTFEANTLGFLQGEFNAEFRRAIARKTKEAMLRRAQQGHVTGGKVFGYDNVQANGHVERCINAVEADVVRAIYQRYADGEGFKQIAHGLNAQKVPSPRPQRGRPAGWEPSTVRAVLRRDLYRGLIVYNKTKKRLDDGSRRGCQRKKPESEWVKIDAPQLRLISAELAVQVEARLEGRRHAYLRTTNGRLLGRPVEGKRLLSGFLVCACGARFEAVKSWQGQHTYVCSARRRKGLAVCPSEMAFPVEALEHMFLNCIEHDVLSQEFIDRVLDAAFAGNPDAERQTLIDERAQVAREIENLTKAIAAGGDIPALATALGERDRRLKVFDAQLAKPVVLPDREVLKAALELRKGQWRDLLRGPHVAQARLVLQHLIDLPVYVMNEPAPKWMTRTRPGGLLVGLVQSVASPMPASWNQIAGWLKQIDLLREAA